MNIQLRKTPVALTLWMDDVMLAGRHSYCWVVPSRVEYSKPKQLIQVLPVPPQILFRLHWDLTRVSGALRLVTGNVLQLWTPFVPVFPLESRFYGFSALFRSHKIRFGMSNFPAFPSHKNIQ